MKELRQLVAQSVYADEAYFSDQLLLPALAEGHHVTLVTAFVPSYLMRLVEDLASSPEIEPGKLTVILCVPFSSSEAVSEARLLSRYISLSGASLTEAKTLLESAADLALEGSLRLGALFSKQDQLLTPSCLGIIESGVPGSSEMVSLVDSTPGDLNSPIAIQGSWEPSLETLDKILRVVVAALNKEFPNLLRKSHQQVFELIRQIRDKGLVKQDFLQEPDQPAGTLKSKPHDG